MFALSVGVLINLLYLLWVISGIGSRRLSKSLVQMKLATKATNRNPRPLLSSLSLRPRTRQEISLGQGRGRLLAALSSLQSSLPMFMLKWVINFLIVLLLLAIV